MANTHYLNTSFTRSQWGRQKTTLHSISSSKIKKRGPPKSWVLSQAKWGTFTIRSKSSLRQLLIWKNKLLKHGHKTIHTEKLDDKMGKTHGGPQSRNTSCHWIQRGGSNTILHPFSSQRTASKNKNKSSAKYWKASKATTKKNTTEMIADRHRTKMRCVALVFVNRLNKSMLQL